MRLQLQATDIASQVVNILAEDLSNSGSWHEGYSSETGAGLAAKGFLSWDTLGASWPTEMEQGVDPFSLGGLF